MECLQDVMMLFCEEQHQIRVAVAEKQELRELHDRLIFWSTVIKVEVAILVVLVISGIFLLRYVIKLRDRTEKYLDAADDRMDGFERRFNGLINYAMLDNMGYLVDMSDFMADERGL